MHFDLIQHIQGFTKRYPADTYLLAVSGGADSMALLHLFHQAKIRFEVLHVNYHLRDEDSNLDQACVENACQELGIPFHLHSVNLRERLEKGGNLQDLARKERYTFFKKKQTEHANALVVLAHHQNDQQETFWLQLLRNAGMMGLAGMKEKNNIYLRPFLGFTKDELVQYLQQNAFVWREDRSNAKNDYLRNRLRNEVLPQLEASFPNIATSVNQLQKVFRENLDEKEKKWNSVFSSFAKTGQITIEQLRSFDETDMLLFFNRFQIPAHQLKGFIHLLEAPTGTKITWILEGEKQALIREKTYLQWVKPTSLKIPKLCIEVIDKLPETFSKSIFYLDEAKLKGNLQLRLWQTGDRLSPPGMKGSKLVSDVLKDAGVPHSERKQIYVLHDDEKLLGCPNFAVDRSALATKNTPRILKVWLE